MMKVCNSVCNECPFAKSSLPGWLGPHTVDGMMDAVNWEHAFSCHMQRKDESTMEDIYKGVLPICRGFIICAEKSSKLFGQHDSKVSKELRRLQKESQITTEEKEKVMDKWGFRKHHEKFIK